MENRDIALGILGGLGFGILMGSELHGTVFSVLGALMLSIALIAMIVSSYESIRA